jgi:hypothetical protein
MEIDISELKTLIEEKELISDEFLEEIKKYKLMAIVNDVYLAKCFLIVYNFLYINLSYFTQNDKNPLKERLTQIKYEINMNELTKYLNSYGDGNEIGSHYTSQNILEIVTVHRDLMIELVNLFSELFGDND